VAVRYPTYHILLKLGLILSQVRNGVHVTRVYLEQASRDSTFRPTLVETEIPPPAQEASDSPYTIWSLDNVPDGQYSIGAVIDGVTFAASVDDVHSPDQWPPC
jgi:hypothetical protein